MSEFLDKLSANLTNAGRTVSQKVKNSSDASKLMNEITAENRNIQENFNAIGKLYYDTYKDNSDEAFRPMVDAILKSEKRIAELQESVVAVRARKPELVPVPDGESHSSPVSEESDNSTMVCPSCGNTYSAGNTFCSVCGQKLVSQPAPESKQPEVVNAEVVEETTFCPYCGKKIEKAGQEFCDNCGHAL